MLEQCCKPKVPGNNSDMFNLIKESCPYNNWTNVARERCHNPDHFHCLKDEYGRIGWVCKEPIWLEKGICSKTSKQIYLYTQKSLDLIFTLNNSLNIMHLTVSEMDVIIYLKAYQFIPKYFTKVKN